jgi:hypothetical protein
MSWCRIFRRSVSDADRDSCQRLYFANDWCSHRFVVMTILILIMGHSTVEIDPSNYVVS